MNPSNYITPRPCDCAEIIGQLTHDAQVTDDEGNVLVAEWWFMDSQGADLSQHFITDDAGRFHWSIEGRDPSNIFLNVTAGPGYEAKVFTPDELLAAPLIILAATKPGTNLFPILVLGGLGVALLSTRGRSVGGFDPVAKYKGMTTGQQTLVQLGALALVGFLVYKFVFKYTPTQQQTDYLNGAKNELARLAAEDGILPSYDNSQFAAWATSLTQAFDDCGTDEDTVYRIFSALHNTADVYKLIVACGVLSFKPCLVQGGVYFGDTNLTLSEAMTSELSGSELAQVNEILATKQINFSF